MRKFLSILMSVALLVSVLAFLPAMAETERETYTTYIPVDAEKHTVADETWEYPIVNGERTSGKVVGSDERQEAHTFKDGVCTLCGYKAAAATATPQPTATPEVTATPEITATPAATATPEITATPAATATPEITATPEVTAAPEITATPKPEEEEESEEEPEEEPEEESEEEPEEESEEEPEEEPEEESEEEPEEEPQPLITPTPTPVAPVAPEAEDDDDDDAGDTAAAVEPAEAPETTYSTLSGANVEQGTPVVEAMQEVLKAIPESTSVEITGVDAEVATQLLDAINSNVDLDTLLDILANFPVEVIDGVECYIVTLKYTDANGNVSLENFAFNKLDGTLVKVY